MRERVSPAIRSLKSRKSLATAASRLGGVQFDDQTAQRLRRWRHIEQHHLGEQIGTAAVAAHMSRDRQRSQRAADNVQQQFTFGIEMTIERTHGQTGAPRDLVNQGRVEALEHE